MKVEKHPTLSSISDAQLKAEPSFHVSLCIEGLDGLGGRSPSEVFAKGDPANLSFHAASFECRSHLQNQPDPTEDRRDDGHNTQRPSAVEVEGIASTPRGDGQEQQPLAKPRQRTRLSRMPGGLPLAIKPPLHFALRARSDAIILAKRSIYVHFIQCVERERKARSNRAPRLRSGQLSA